MSLESVNSLRAHPRFEADYLAYVEVEVDLERIIYTSKVKNISKGGASIDCFGGRFKVGDRIQVGFQDQNQNQFKISAEVRWIRDPSGEAVENCLGVQFMELFPGEMPQMGL